MPVDRYVWIGSTDFTGDFPKVMMMTVTWDNFFTATRNILNNWGGHSIN